MLLKLKNSWQLTPDNWNLQGNEKNKIKIIIMFAYYVVKTRFSNSEVGGKNYTA